MSDTARPKSAGDRLSADEINQDLPIEMTAGTPISATPQAVYISTDGKVYDSKAGTPSTANFNGFALDVAGGSGSPISVQIHGVVSGFSGLSIGEQYYVQSNGTIGTPQGTFTVPVGVAVSATQILIQSKGNRMFHGTGTVPGATGDVSCVCGFRPKLIWVKYAYANCVSDGFGDPTWYYCTYAYCEPGSYGSGNVANVIIYVTESKTWNESTSATIKSFSATGFILTFTIPAHPPGGTFYWIAIE